MRIKIANQLLIKKKLNIILDEEILPAGPIFKKKFLLLYFIQKKLKKTCQTLPFWRNSSILTKFRLFLSISFQSVTPIFWLELVTSVYNTPVKVQSIDNVLCA